MVSFEAKSGFTNNWLKDPLMPSNAIISIKVLVALLAKGILINFISGSVLTSKYLFKRVNRVFKLFSAPLSFATHYNVLSIYACSSIHKSYLFKGYVGILNESMFFDTNLSKYLIETFWTSFRLVSTCCSSITP